MLQWRNVAVDNAIPIVKNVTTLVFVHSGNSETKISDGSLDFDRKTGKAAEGGAWLAFDRHDINGNPRGPIQLAIAAGDALET